MDAQHNQKKHLVKQSGTALGRELTQSNSLAFSLAHSTVPTIVIMLIAGRRMKSKNTSAHLTRRAEMQQIQSATRNEIRMLQKEICQATIGTLQVLNRTRNVILVDMPWMSRLTYIELILSFKSIIMYARPPSRRISKLLKKMLEPIDLLLNSLP